MAMSGWIMPDPLAMPPMVTVRPLMRVRRTTDFGLRSVVKMARAACAPPSAAEAIKQRRQRLHDTVDR